MSIVPTGKTRLMVSQNIVNPLSDGYNNGEAASSVSDNIKTSQIEDAGYYTPDFNQYGEKGSFMTGLPEENQQIDNQAGDFKSINEEEDFQSIDERDYVVEKYIEFGYPPRRVREFEKKLLKEEIDRDGSKRITITLPDSYYPDDQGNIKRVTSKNIKNIADEMYQKFGLVFDGANSDNGEWTVKMTSERPQEDEDTGPKDRLEEMFGSPTQTRSTKQRKAAYSQRELIKMSKTDDLINKLSNLNGENNAS